MGIGHAAHFGSQLPAGSRATHTNGTSQRQHARYRTSAIPLLLARHLSQRPARSLLHLRQGRQPAAFDASLSAIVPPQVVASRSAIMPVSQGSLHGLACSRVYLLQHIAADKSRAESRAT
jgi:hypothetical protein